MFRESEIKSELQKSKYVRTWGRDVLFAIDRDDPVEIIEIFKKKYHNEANLNEQTSRWNYGGYAWTAYMHDFIGDTALHLAIKQKKMKCIYALLLMTPDTTIQNFAGETPDDLAIQILNKTIKGLQAEATYGLLPNIDPRDFHILPDNICYRNIERESWRIMMQGKSLYAEPPHCLQGKKLKERAMTRGGGGSGGSINRSDTIGSILNRYSSKGMNEEEEEENPANELDALALLNKETVSTKSNNNNNNNNNDDNNNNNNNDNNNSNNKHNNNSNNNNNNNKGAAANNEQSSIGALSSSNNCSRDTLNGGGIGSSPRLRTPVVTIGGLEDIWGRGNLEDVIRILHQQMNRIHLERKRERLRQSGLSLLANTAPKLVPESLHLYRGEGAVDQFPGLNKLPFAKNAFVNADAIKSPPPKKIIGHFIPTIDPNHEQSPENRNSVRRILSQTSVIIRKKSMEENELNKIVQNAVKASSNRYITEVSTYSNLRYTSLGDEGVTKLSIALKRDSLIRSIVLVSARLGNIGCSNLCKIVSTMPNLTNINLSMNHIDDDSVPSLARSITDIKKLKYLNLSANRLTVTGIAKLIPPAMQCYRLLELNLHNNKLSEDEKEFMKNKIANYDTDLFWNDFNENEKNNDDSLDEFFGIEDDHDDDDEESSDRMMGPLGVHFPLSDMTSSLHGTYSNKNKLKIIV